MAEEATSSVDEAASYRTLGVTPPADAPLDEQPVVEEEATEKDPQEAAESAAGEEETEESVEAAEEEVEEELDPADQIVSRVREIATPEASKSEEPEVDRMRRELAVAQARLEEREKALDQKIVGPAKEAATEADLTLDNPDVVAELAELAKEDAEQYSRAMAEVTKRTLAKYDGRIQEQNTRFDELKQQEQQRAVSQYAVTQIEEQAKTLEALGDYGRAVYREYQKFGGNSHLGQALAQNSGAIAQDMARAAAEGRQSTLVTLIGSGIASLWEKAEANRASGDSPTTEEEAAETAGVRGKAPRRVQKKNKARGEPSIEEQIAAEIVGGPTAADIMPALRRKG